MTYRTTHCTFAALATLAAATFTATDADAQFVTGDVYYAAASGEIVDITAGGDLTGQFFVDTGQYTIGQLAWSRDLDTMYLSLYASGEVIAIDPMGNYTTYADNLSGPSGLLMTRDGTLLVAEHDTGEITDITAGGDQTMTTPLTVGLSGPRDMVELADGTVLVADQVTYTVHDALYPNGGTVGTPFATGLIVVRGMTVTSNNTLYAALRQFQQGAFTGVVVDITAGGDFTGATPFAYGQPLFSLTETANGDLLSGELDNGEGDGGLIWNITAGGDFSMATPFASGLPEGETPLAAVPPPVCGSGVVGPGEECDDGNDDDTDDCLNDCTMATCGDGVVWAGMEECDDGNLDDGDGCSSACETEQPTGAGGAGGAGGTGGTSNPTGAGGSMAGAGGSGGNLDGGGQVSEDSGCGCHTGEAGDPKGWWAALALLGLGLSRRRRTVTCVNEVC